MRRTPRVLLAWSAALVVALTTAHVVGGDLAALHRRAASLGPLRRIVVATHDLELGQSVAARDLRTESRYAREIPRAALTDPRAAIGHVVIVPVLRDAVLFGAHLARSDRTGLDAVVPPGDRAVRVVPKDGFRPPRGTVVDVLAAFDPSVVTVEGGGNAAVVVARAARVITADSPDTDGGAGGTSSGVTVVVTEAEARVIAFAAATADLTLAVDPPESACCTTPATG
jgi:Flp pilus assembly protein CpaB